MILWAVVDPGDRSDFRPAARKLFNRSGIHPPLCAALPTIGEMSMLLSQKADARRFATAMETFHSLVRRQKLESIWMPPNNQNVFKTVATVHACDRRMEAADALIIACALLDDRARVLHSVDPYTGWSRVRALFDDAGKELLPLHR